MSYILKGKQPLRGVGDESAFSNMLVVMGVLTTGGLWLAITTRKKRA